MRSVIDSLGQMWGRGEQIRPQIRGVLQSGPLPAILCPSSSPGVPSPTATRLVNLPYLFLCPHHLCPPQKNLCVLKSPAFLSRNPHFRYHNDSQSQQERMFQKGTSILAFCLKLRVAGARPLGEVCCFHVLPRGRQPGSGSSRSSLSVAGGVSATLTGLHHHVREMFHLGGPPNVVQDGQGLQVLGHAARGGRRFRVQSVIQAQHLGRMQR